MIGFIGILQDCFFINMYPGKSSGSDGWHPFPFKKLCDMIKVLLAILFQNSLREGVVPSQWLEASVTAIHKKGLKNYFENYRAASITSIICKLLESIVRDKLVCHNDEEPICFRTNNIVLCHRGIVLQT